jgi:hypothetical protein
MAPPIVQGLRLGWKPLELRARAAASHRAAGRFRLGPGVRHYEVANHPSDVKRVCDDVLEPSGVLNPDVTHLTARPAELLADIVCVNSPAIAFEHDSLTDEQTETIRQIYGILSPYLNGSSEQFELNFLRDLHLEREILIWTLIARAIRPEIADGPVIKIGHMLTNDKRASDACLCGRTCHLAP